jgi:hypothetical protein
VIAQGRDGESGANGRPLMNFVRCSLAVLSILTLLTGCNVRSLLDPDPSSAIPLRITSLAASVGASGHDFLVSLEVSNGRSRVEDGKIWWILSPAGTISPWDHQVYRSTTQYVSVPPRSQHFLQWTEDALIPQGFYELSAWVHVADGTGREVHSDGKTTRAFYVGNPNASRRFALSGPIDVEAVDAPTSVVRGQHVLVLASVRNRTDHAQVARVWWLLAPTGDNTPWGHPASVSDFIQLTLAPFETRGVLLPGIALAPPGTYVFSAWVHVRSASGQFQHSDGVWAVQPTYLNKA